MDESLEFLTERLRRYGADDAESWASSEFNEGIPQTATYIALRNLWPNLIHPWRDVEVLERVPATKALLDAGVAPEAVSKAMCLAAFQGVIGTLWELQGDEVPDDAPHIHFVEADADCNLTGRDVEGLHESLLTMDPTGQDGADFLG